MAAAYTTPEFVGLASASLIMLVMYLNKFTNIWKKTDAETSVISLMRTELERMSEQNTSLQLELNKLQKEIISLNKELRNLTIENQKLHAEVAALTGEVTRLQLLINTADE